MKIKVLSNQIFSIVFSLVFAFGLWLILAGQDTNALDLSVPLELVDLPADLAIRGEVPTSLTFQVLANTAQGRFMADRKLQLRLSLAAAQEGSNVFPIDHEALDLPRGVTVRKVSPSGIEFEAIRVSRRQVPLSVTLDGQPNPAYRIRSVILEPDQVTVSGPQEKVLNMESLPTTPVSVAGLSADSIQTVNPSPGALEPGMEVSPREIKVSISVEERRLEEIFEIPIEVDFKNGGSRSNLILSPDKASISVSWPASRSRGVKAEDIKVHVFIDEEKLRAEGRLTPPVVAVAPPGVDITAIDPINTTIIRRTASRPEGLDD